ncbi:hypothetical protein Q5O14_07725 [Eubacteriaceae bacterium ES2]|nr:hypothetical protein Q5O14_07725 [Eubacteriaceae bacterium ES2]
MKITIETEVKEIAALVKELQERQEKTISESIVIESNKDIHRAQISNMIKNELKGHPSNGLVNVGKIIF